MQNSFGQKSSCAFEGKKKTGTIYVALRQKLNTRQTIHLLLRPLQYIHLYACFPSFIRFCCFPASNSMLKKRPADESYVRIEAISFQVLLNWKRSGSMPALIKERVCAISLVPKMISALTISICLLWIQTSRLHRLLLRPVCRTAHRRKRVNSIGYNKKCKLTQSF